MANVSKKYCDVCGDLMWDAEVDSDGATVDKFPEGDVIVNNAVLMVPNPSKNVGYNNPDRVECNIDDICDKCSEAVVTTLRGRGWKPPEKKR